MEPIIPKAIRRLKTLYIVHIIVIALILIFNFISVSQIYWLKNILKKLYLLSTIISIIFFTLPIISLIFICTKKLKKSNFNTFKILTLIFCVMTITLGFFFSGISGLLDSLGTSVSAGLIGVELQLIILVLVSFFMIFWVK